MNANNLPDSHAYQMNGMGHGSHPSILLRMIFCSPSSCYRFIQKENCRYDSSLIRFSSKRSKFDWLSVVSTKAFSYPKFIIFWDTILRIIRKLANCVRSYYLVNQINQVPNETSFVFCSSVLFFFIKRVISWLVYRALAPLSVGLIVILSI